MKQSVIILSAVFLASLAAGCQEADQFQALSKCMEGLSPESELTAVERAEAEYVIYYLNQREQDWFNPNLSKVNPLNLLPPSMRFYFSYIPPTDRVAAFSSYHRRIPVTIPILEEDKTKDIAIEMSRSEALQLAGEVLDRRFLDFLKDRCDELCYDDVRLAADRIRDSFLRDLFMYELPVALGPDAAPLLIRTVDTTQDRFLISGCISNLQIITGLGGDPEARYTPDMTPAEARKVLKVWRQWSLARPGATGP